MPSFDRPTDTAIPPSPWILRHAHLVRPGGAVLDVAAGHGRHTRFFAARGCRVTAADIDLGALRADPPPHTTLAETDLEQGPWPFAPAAFDAVIVTNYLYRPAFADWAASLAPGGVVLIDTFAAGHEQLGRPRNPAFLLAPNELLEAFAPRLTIVAYEFGREESPRPAVRQRLCAVRGAEARRLGR